MLVLGKRMIFSGLRGKIGADLINLYTKKIFNRDYFELDFSIETTSKTIIHMAACSNINKNKKIINSNIRYLNKVINYANKNKIENFIFFSAVSVYGRGGYNEIDENSPLYNPNIYGISKLIGEEMLRQSGIKRVLCLRLPTVLSVSDNGSFLFKWLNSAIHNRDITAFNMQNKFNNFISINSLFDFIFNIKLYDGFDIINLGSSGNLSIYEFIEYLKQKTNSKSNLKDLGKNSFFSLNLSKAAIKYGFCPLSSEQSIDEWLQNRYERFYKLRTRPKSSNSIFF